MSRLGGRPEERYQQVRKQHQGYMGRTARLGTLPLDQLGDPSSSSYPRAALSHMTTHEGGNQVVVKVYHNILTSRCCSRGHYCRILFTYVTCLLSSTSNDKTIYGDFSACCTLKVFASTATDKIRNVSTILRLFVYI